MYRIELEALPKGTYRRILYAFVFQPLGKVVHQGLAVGCAVGPALLVLADICADEPVPQCQGEVHARLPERDRFGQPAEHG